MSAPPASPGPKRVRRSHAERSGETRMRILDAAVQCIATEGLPRTNLARIAERAGLSLGAIQHQFGDKSGVLMAVVERGFERLLDAVARLPVAPPELHGRVAVLVDSIWAHYALPESRAALEIVLQMRGDGDFRARALPYLVRIRGAIDRMWMGFFWEMGAPRARHVRAQRLLFTTLNGLAFESSLVPAMPDLSADLKTLSDTLVRILTEAP